MRQGLEVLPDVQPMQKLMSCPTTQLMQQFGAGRPTPGSGSAAALQGVLACSMVLATARLTMKKAKDKRHRQGAEYIGELIEGRHFLQLEALVQTDSDVFDQAIAARKRYKACAPGRERKRLASRARKLLTTATEIPLEIAQHCLEVAKHGLRMFDIGYVAARGDPAAAVTAAIAGATTAVCVITQNMTKFRKSRWSEHMLSKCDEIWAAINVLQEELRQKVTRFRDNVRASFEGQSSLFN